MRAPEIAPAAKAETRARVTHDFTRACPACNGEGHRYFPSDICQMQVDVWPADDKVVCDCCDGTGIDPTDDFDADDSGAQTHEVEPPTADEVEAEIFDETVGTAQLFKIFSNNRSIHAR